MLRRDIATTSPACKIYGSKLGLPIDTSGPPATFGETRNVTTAIADRPSGMTRDEAIDLVKQNLTWVPEIAVGMLKLDSPEMTNFTNVMDRVNGAIMYAKDKKQISDFRIISFVKEFVEAARDYVF